MGTRQHCLSYLQGRDRASGGHLLSPGLLRRGSGLTGWLAGGRGRAGRGGVSCPTPVLAVRSLYELEVASRAQNRVTGSSGFFSSFSLTSLLKQGLMQSRVTLSSWSSSLQMLGLHACATTPLGLSSPFPPYLSFSSFLFPFFLFFPPSSSFSFLFVVVVESKVSLRP